MQDKENYETEELSKSKYYLNKIDNVLNKIKYPLEFLLSLLFVYLAFRLVFIHHNSGYWALEHILYIIPVAISLLGMIIYTLYKSGKKIEKIFLSIIIPIGMFYLIFMIPSNVADELAHLWKTYEVSEGILVSSKDEATKVPKDLVFDLRPYVNNYKEFINVINEPTDYNDLEEVNNTAKTYPSTLYLFSAIGMLVGKIMHLNILLSSYLAQIMNFIVFLIAGYFTLKLLPFGKLPMMVLLFTPMMLHQATSTSSDAMINASVLLFIGFVMHLIFKEDKITRKEQIGFFALAVFVALAKYVYLPVVGIGLILIFSKNMTKKAKAILLSSTIVVCGVIAIGWYLFTSTYPSPYEEYLATCNVNSSEQISYIIDNPVKFVKMIGNTILMDGQKFIYGAIGNLLGWADIVVNDGWIVTFLVVLIASCFLEKNKVSLKAWQRIYILLIAAGIIALVITGLYLIWTPVGQNIAAGIQGRYFIPVLPLLLLCLSMKDNYVKVKNIEYILPILLAVLNIPVLLTIYNSFI